MLDREHLAGAGEAALHLVDDEQDAVAVAERTQLAQERRWRDVEAAFSLHRFDDQCGDTLRVDIVLEEVFDRRQRRLHADAVVLHRERCVVDVGQHRAEACFVGVHLAGEADAGEGAAVETATEGDHRGSSGVVSRDLHGVLDRLGAGREEDRLPRSRPGRQIVQAFGEGDIVLVGRDLEAGVREPCELRRHGPLHLRVQVPGVEHGDTRAEVDVAATLDIPDLAVGCALGVDLEGISDTPGDGGCTAASKVGIGGHGGLRGGAGHGCLLEFTC